MPLPFTLGHERDRNEKDVYRWTEVLNLRSMLRSMFALINVRACRELNARPNPLSQELSPLGSTKLAIVLSAPNMLPHLRGPSWCSLTRRMHQSGGENGTRRTCITCITPRGFVPTATQERADWWQTTFNLPIYRRNISLRDKEKRGKKVRAYALNRRQYVTRWEVEQKLEPRWRRSASLKAAHVVRTHRSDPRPRLRAMLSTRDPFS